MSKAVIFIWYQKWLSISHIVILTHCRCKNLLLDFITVVPILIDWKSERYNSILVIVDYLTKIVYYRLVKVMIDAPGLAKLIINLVLRHYGISESIVINQGLLFTSKFWSLLCYFLPIKKRLFTAFHPQTNG